MENPEKKGTVTSLSSIFPAEKAYKESKRVLDTIAERQKELHQLHHFISDNKNLVPFGKPALFLGFFYSRQGVPGFYPGLTSDTHSNSSKAGFFGTVFRHSLDWVKKIDINLDIPTRL